LTGVLILIVQIEIKQEEGECPSPSAMAGQVVSYLEEKGFLED
jgi:adenylylsulfate kinase